MLIRHEIGDVLREIRLSQKQTLRQVASRATVALGYLSEIERGQKEASSEILASLAAALNVPVSAILLRVANRMAAIEGFNVPDSVPATFATEAPLELDAFDRFLLGTANEQSAETR
ncbi:MAG: helix-turn-helix domain-containing protein [Micrococcales bacterium]